MNNLDYQKPLFSRISFFSQSLILIGLILACLILSSILTIVIGMWIGIDISPESLPYLRLSQIISSVGIFLLPALIFGYISDKKWFSYGSANRLPQLGSVLWILVLAICLIPTVNLLAYWNEQMQLPEIFAGIEAKMRAMEESAAAVLELMVSDLSAKNLFINLIIMAVLPAICEEFLFRGAIQPLLQRATKNHHWAIWITAFIFSAIHLQFYGFIPRFLLGAYLGYLLVWSGSLWLPILAHFLQNALSVTSHFIMTRSSIDMEEMTPSDIPYFPVIVIGAVLLFVVGMIFVRRENSGTEVK